MNDKRTDAGRWWQGLRLQALIWIVLPLALILALVATTGFYAYERVVRSLAEARDQELARVSAGRLSENMESYADILTALANGDEIKSGEAGRQSQALALARSQGLLDAFDGGVIILNGQGLVTVSVPHRPDLMEQNMAIHPYFQNTRALRRPTFSDIFQETGSSENVIVVTAPILRDGRFQGLIAGTFYIKRQRLGEAVLKLKVGDRGLVYLVDRNGQVIYHPEAEAIGQDFGGRLAVEHLMHAEEGALVAQDSTGERAVFGFAIVPATGWGLVIKEPWAQVVAPIASYLRIIVLVLMAGFVLTATMISLGMRRITEPIANLVDQTAQVARGDFEARVRLGTIREIRELGLAFNAMVEQVDRYRAGLRRYVAAITHSQEEERKRIARDLHDDTIQSLIAMGQRLELCRASLQNDSSRTVSEATAQLSDIRRMVTETIETLRQFSRDLRPMALEDLGLIPALQFLVNDLARSDSIQAHLETSGSPQGLPPDLEVAIYRIVQEALWNVRKHAQAGAVTVRAQFNPQEVEISVEDDGVGFVVPEAVTDLASLGSFGLLGIEERVQLLGGRLEIVSQPGHGTRLGIVLPREIPPPPVFSDLNKKADHNK